MRALRLALVPAAALTVMPVTADATAPAQQERIVIAQFVDRAVDYVRAYQAELTSVVAEERYTQEIRAQVPSVKGPRERTLTSEVFFMFVPGHAWMAIRDVLRVDDEPVENRFDVRKALDELSPSEVSARLKAFNARFNVGRVVRNFNEPTFGLLVLDDRHRESFDFSRARRQSGDDPSRVRLAFREARQPTIIRDLDGRPAYLTGVLTMDPASGRIDDIEARVTVGPLDVTLRTEFEVDPRLDMAVPVRFTEHYTHGRAPRDGRVRGRHEEIVCEATYSNFKRFEVRAKVK